MFIKKGKRTAVDFVEQAYEPVLLEFYNNLQNSILMKDNAPVHTAKLCKEVEGRAWI